MNIVVVIPDERQLATAGVRIRYNRLRSGIEAAGNTFRIITIDAYRGADALGADVALFCKCHDARSLLIADELRSAGVAVGVDLFDDYFTDRTDSRFVHLREWLRGISASLSFAICATSAMRDRIGGILRSVPLHVVNDPYHEFDADAVAGIIDLKLARALATRRFDICWFGIGDNPHFPVGLSDLHAFNWSLTAITRAGFHPRLSIITNRRALTVHGLEQVSRLPVPFTLEEWSEEIERRTIEESLCCFLPVNGQGFSVVKSLNRAITALTGGAQALSTGYPLYRELGRFIYEDAGTLASDVAAGRPALRRETASELVGTLADWAGPQIEAERLLAFLQTAPRPTKTAQTAVRSIVHGIRTIGGVHKLCQRQGALSIASPFSRAVLNYDLSLSDAHGAGQMVAVLSTRAKDRLRDDLREKVVPLEKKDRKQFFAISLKDIGLEPPAELTALQDSDHRSVSVATMSYRPCMRFMSDVIRTLFGRVSVHMSELGSPVWADAHQTFASAEDRDGVEADAA